MKSKTKKATFTILTVSLVLLITFFSFIYHPTFSKTNNPNRSEDTIVHQITGSIAYVSIPDLFERSSLVVEGTISNISDAFQIKSNSGTIANFCDYQFDVSSIIRGSLPDETNSVEIRVQGGTVGNYTEIYSGTPDFNVGDDYLLFLYQPGRGGSFNTEGDYYYVLGMCQGVFTKDDSGQYISQSGEELSNDYLIQCATATNNTVDPNYFRNEYIENQKRNLENGFLSQEEFDQLMLEIDDYATIISGND